MWRVSGSVEMLSNRPILLLLMKTFPNLPAPPSLPPAASFEVPAEVTTDVAQGERQALYASRSCLFVTTRILVVDLLSSRIRGEQIAGMIVLNAHRWVGAGACGQACAVQALPAGAACLPWCSSVPAVACCCLYATAPPTDKSPYPLPSCRVTDSSGEGFAVRLFKAACPRGVVRAISDQPSSFASEFNKVRQAVLVALYMQAVYCRRWCRRRRH